MTSAYDVDARNRVRQLRDKANYDRATVHAVLDAGLVAHVGFVQDGQPVVVPMIYGRDGDTLYLHGARKARVVRLLESGADVCVNVTLIDAIVVARSAFNSSMNYRSATVFGTPTLISDAAAALHALKVISEHTLPGRWDTQRPPHERERKMTGVVALPIDAASAKISSAMPGDEDEDYELPIWAGVLGVETRLTELKDDGRVLDGVTPSADLTALAHTKR